MGLFERVKKKESMQVGIDQYFKLMNAYSPAFSTFEGGLYEMELTRAAIHSFAQHCSKLRPVVKGSGNEILARNLKYKPNALMDTKKYIARLATAYKVDNTVFIAPLYDKYGDINGYYPLIKSKCKLIETEGGKYLRYELTNGNYAAIELERCGLMNQMQYKDELFGESNKVMKPTMELIDMNNQGIVNGVKAGASIRFLARLAMTLKQEDIDKERKRFVESNLSTENNGGVMLFDQKYAEVKQVDSKPFVVDAEQMKAIKENVFNYFGTNEAIIQSKFTSAEWNSFYEAQIEPFAIEAGLVHTNMTFSEREIAFGNEIEFAANRMQYMNNTEKLNTVTQLFDRGLITLNEGREILNLDSVEGGDHRYIRKEYALYDDTEGGKPDADETGETVQDNEPEDSTEGTAE